MGTWESLISEEKYYEERLQHLEQCDVWIKELNQYLANQTLENVIKYIKLLRQKEVCEHGINVKEELAYANLFQVIAAEELEVYKYTIFLSNGTSLDELKKVIKKIEFCLWEMEFVGDEASEEAVLNCIVNYRLTPECLRRIIQVAALDKEKMYLQITYLYLYLKKTQEAILLLRYGVENYPENIELRKMLVKLCEQIGFTTIAEQYCVRMGNENADEKR